MKTDTDAEQPERTNRDKSTASLGVDSSRARILRASFRFFWPVLYLTTVAGMIWWYEFRPTVQVSRTIQGTWQTVEGMIPNEQRGNSYLHIDGNDSWFVYPFRDEWQVHRSRINVRPAEHFFVVRRSFGFDYGTTREREYVLHLKNDAMYILRGLARLDSVMERSIEKLRSVDSLPDDAKASIQKYLQRTQKDAAD